jgi:hypothetical protein
MASAATQIKIRVTEDNEEERRSNDATIKAGHLLELLSTDKVQRHTTYGGRPMKWIALEDGLRGWPRNQYDVYESGTVVPIHAWGPGERLAMRLPANAPAVVIGDALVSNGDGCVVKSLRSGDVLLNTAAAGTPISNTVSTEQFFDQTYSVPANMLKVGDVLHIRGFAVVSAQASTDTLTVKVYIGAIAIVTTAAVDSAVGDVVWFDAYVRIRTIGASGTFVADNMSANGPPATATTKPGFIASSALDTTAANIVRASATWSATTATNTVALQGLTIDILRTAKQEVIAIAGEAIDNSAGATEALIIATMI